jgi:hypothetical protein
MGVSGEHDLFFLDRTIKKHAIYTRSPPQDLSGDKVVQKNFALPDSAGMRQEKNPSGFFALPDSAGMRPENAASHQRCGRGSLEKLPLVESHQI